MEILIILLVLLVFGFIIFKVAKSKNREPAGWILTSVIISPIIILLILALMPPIPGKKKTKKKIKPKKVKNLKK
tara:strand:- start:290 stop:511 length:222 start_codon:yes stop_codon:yes gene_type:complete